MTCMEAEKMVIPYINDQLSVTELEDFIEHIKTCENCREELEIHYMVDVGLKKLDEADGTYDIGDDVENAGTAKRAQRLSCGASSPSRWPAMPSAP